LSARDRIDEDSDLRLPVLLLQVQQPRDDRAVHLVIHRSLDNDRAALQELEFKIIGPLILVVFGLLVDSEVDAYKLHWKRGSKKPFTA
jgi:hypothetical protein